MTMVTCLKIFRGKDLVAPSVIMPVLFKLFKCKDKELRKFLHNGLICDLKRLNLVNKSNGINKKMQNFIFEMLQDPNETASKRALSVMIELYKRKIWNDDKTVNVIAEGCLHDNPKVVAAATKFFLILDYDWESDSDGDVDASDEEMEQKMIQGKYKGTKKMTKARIHKAAQAQGKEEEQDKVLDRLPPNRPDIRPPGFRREGVQQTAKVNREVRGEAAHDETHLANDRKTSTLHPAFLPPHFALPAKPRERQDWRDIRYDH